MVNKMKSVQHERLQRALPFGLLKKKKNSLGFPFLFFNGALISQGCLIAKRQSL